MIHDTERITVREAINLLEHCGIRPPMRIRGSASYWLCEEVEQGRLVFHDHTGLRIEPVEYLGVFGLYKETTSRTQLNAWLERIGHLRRVPETGDLPAEPVKLCEFDEESRPVFSVPLCPAGVPAELLALGADTPVVGIETSGAYYTTASKLADHIRGLMPASVTCEAAAAPTPAPSASAPAVARPESVAPPAVAAVAPAQTWRLKPRPKNCYGYTPALRDFLERWHRDGKPKPTAMDFLDYVRETKKAGPPADWVDWLVGVTGKSLKYRVAKGEKGPIGTDTISARIKANCDN